MIQSWYHLERFPFSEKLLQHEWDTENAFCYVCCWCLSLYCFSVFSSLFAVCASDFFPGFMLSLSSLQSVPHFLRVWCGVAFVEGFSRILCLICFINRVRFEAFWLQAFISIFPHCFWLVHFFLWNFHMEFHFSQIWCFLITAVLASISVFNVDPFISSSSHSLNSVLAHVSSV